MVDDFLANQAKAQNRRTVLEEAFPHLGAKDLSKREKRGDGDGATEEVDREKSDRKSRQHKTGSSTGTGAKCSGNSTPTTTAELNLSNICRLHLKQKCRKGDKCNYAHNEPCKFFVTGTCNKGNRCPFPHVEPLTAHAVQERTSPAPTPSPTLTKKAKTAAKVQTAAATGGDDSRSSGAKRVQAQDAPRQLPKQVRFTTAPPEEHELPDDWWQHMSWQTRAQYQANKQRYKGRAHHLTTADMALYNTIDNDEQKARFRAHRLRIDVVKGYTSHPTIGDNFSEALCPATYPHGQLNRITR